MHFPTISLNHAKCSFVKREEWDMEPSEIYKGLKSNHLKHVYFKGFSTLRHIKHSVNIINGLYLELYMYI